MNTALEQAQKLIGPVDLNSGTGWGELQLAIGYAAIAKAEAAERQAAAAEKQAEYLGRIMTAVEYMATGGVEDMPPALIADVPPFWVDDDQRAEDDRNRNADLRAADRAGGF